MVCYWGRLNHSKRKRLAGHAALVAKVSSVHKIVFGKLKKHQLGDSRIQEEQEVKLWIGDKCLRNGGLK
jgi:hypothetical protein